VTEALRFIANPDLDYDSWVRIGLAIKGALGDDGWPLFEAWSGRAPKNVPETTVKAWQGLKPTRIGAGTLYKLALEAGWEPAPTLQLNGALIDERQHPAKEFLHMLETAMPMIGPVTAPQENSPHPKDPPKAH
jgi:hypothetical protein